MSGPRHFPQLLLLCLQGLRKRELLKELLPVIGQNLRFQRLFTECQEQLDILRDKQPALAIPSFVRGRTTLLLLARARASPPPVRAVVERENFVEGVLCCTSTSPVPGWTYSMSQVWDDSKRGQLVPLIQAQLWTWGWYWGFALLPGVSSNLLSLCPAWPQGRRWLLTRQMLCCFRSNEAVCESGAWERQSYAVRRQTRSLCKSKAVLTHGLFLYQNLLTWNMKFLLIDQDIPISYLNIGHLQEI